jgi:3-dehydrosphinganine reductase
MTSPFKNIIFNPETAKFALITGGSSGIGLATAKLLASKGLHIWIIARHQEQLDKAVDSLEASRVSPDQIFNTISADVSDWDQTLDVIDQVNEEIGTPDLLINSAGVVQPGYFQELKISDFHWMMDVNYFGTVYYTKAVLPGMIQRGSGYIVQISSMSGMIGIFGYTAYSGSKFAVRGFTDALRSELKPMGIGVSIVYPADTDTPQLEYENKYKPEETRIISGKADLRPPEEIADLILNGIQRGHYQIIPKGEPMLLYKLSNIVGAGRNVLIDWWVSQAQSKMNK